MSEATKDQPTYAPDADLEWHRWPLEREGGQRARGTAVGVLVIHKPTGLAAVSVDERSQHGNKQVARAVLRVRLAGDPARFAALESALDEALGGWVDAMRLAPDDRRTPGEKRDEARIAKLRELLDGITATSPTLESELERTRPVYEAACAWHDGDNSDGLREALDIARNAEVDRARTPR